MAAMAEILEPQTLAWNELLQQPWQWVLFGILLTAAALGLTYIAYTVTKGVLQNSRTRRKILPTVRTETLDYLNLLTERLSPKSKPKTFKTSKFAVYLGDFSLPPTEPQVELLTQTELVILNPFRGGVDAAIRNVEGRHLWVARVDLQSFLAQDVTPDQAVIDIARLILTRISESAFTGVLLANWEAVLPHDHLIAVSTYVSVAGLLVYLETGPPNFLQDTTVLGDTAIAGLVIRNAAILPSGEHRDFFDMEKLQPTVRAWVRESCLRHFTVMAWETVDKECQVSNAVMKRGIQWNRFYSAITWIVAQASLTDVEINQTVVEPLGAFEWLKDEGVMAGHSKWRASSSIAYRTNRSVGSAWVHIAETVPETATLLHSRKRRSKSVKEARSTTSGTASSRMSTPTLAQRSTRSMARASEERDSLGCFPIGVDAMPLAFAEVLQAQIRLRNLGLLHPVDQQHITNLGIVFKKFHDRFLVKHEETEADVLDAVHELASVARNGQLRINLGLSPGFAHGAQIRFWAVSHVDNDGEEMFVSRDAHGLASTVLHTFMAARGIARELCFEVESTFAAWNGDLHEKSSLPRRVAQEIESLTPEEAILILEKLSVSESPTMVMRSVRKYVHRQLIEVPTLRQLNKNDSVGYLAGTISSRQLLEARIEWYVEQGVPHPSLTECARFFDKLEERLLWMLRNRRDAELQVFSDALRLILTQGDIDSWADILGLATFCAARRAALEEIFLEVTDRNPLFNDQSDGAAVFAESFALGSRCEAYFDISPSEFGQLLSDRFRARYSVHQPPLWNNGAPDFATAYGGAQMDVDPDSKPKPLPQYQRFTFLSVFAIPALVDIALLTTIGRGLYLSAFMTLDEQRSATIALMISLLFSGAIGTWISCGGSYYLVSMAFSAMNVFVLSRLIGGMALMFAGAIIGFGVVSGVSGIAPGAVFFLYLIAFTGYLTFFAAIASFQFPGSSFLSGRKEIVLCLPILLISPLVTAFTGYDIYVYLCVFYLLLVALCLVLRSIGSRWVTWYQGLKQTNDAEVRKWYTNQKLAGDATILAAMTDPAALKISREALLGDVQAEIYRLPFQKATEDRFVANLAKDWEATNFLLDWYSRYADVPKPLPYSSGWNIQVKVSMQVLVDLQKGIKLHSAFMHWHQSGDEVGCGVLYFVIALMDKWVDLITGVRLVGLSASLNDDFRMAIGFSLAYYLIGAVLIDYKAQELHGAVDMSELGTIQTAAQLRESQKKHVRQRRKMYSRTLFHFLSWHCCGLALTTALTWIFQSSLGATVMFLAYVFSYTGLLWYQYTKIFAGKYALKPLLTAVAIGAPLGIILKKLLPRFHYSGVIALGTTTWLAAILVLRTAKIGMPEKTATTLQDKEVYHSYTKPWKDPELSQAELKEMFTQLISTAADNRFNVDPAKHPYSEMEALLSKIRLSQAAHDAFPNAVRMIEAVIRTIRIQQVLVELVPISEMGPYLRAISRRASGKIHFIIGVRRPSDGTNNMRGNCQIVAELLLHEIAETFFDIPHHHAAVVEQLVCGGLPLNIRTMLAEEAEPAKAMEWAKTELLQHHCLGIRCNVNWDKMSHSVREYFLKRALGQECLVSDQDLQDLLALLELNDVDELVTHVSRCNLAIGAATTIIDQVMEPRPAVLADQQTPLPVIGGRSTTLWTNLEKPFSYLYHTLGFVIKYFTLALVSDPEWHREFNHAIRTRSALTRYTLAPFLNVVFVYSRHAQDICLDFFLFHRRPNVFQLWQESKGMTITHKRHRILIRKPEGTFTAFSRGAGGEKKVYIYKGNLKTEPNSNYSQLQAINTYNASRQLTVREEFQNDESINVFEYDYDVSEIKGRSSKKARSKMPHTRRCTKGPANFEVICYNPNTGLAESGSFFLNGNLVNFSLRYRRNARFLDELLSGEFTMAHMSATVLWCAPPPRNPEKRQRWIPYTKVLQATYMQGIDKFESVWSYDHQMHPTITTKLNGRQVRTPDMIQYDWLGVLKKPHYESFYDEDPLLHASFWNSNWLARTLGLSVRRTPVSTSMARSRLWKEWKGSKELDGVVTRWLDEKLVRKDKVLKRYWRLRDGGQLDKAKRYMDSCTDAVMASVELADDITSWTPIAIRLGDLYTFGPGGDTILHTRALDVGKDTNEKLHVLAVDNGTWPNEGGGVSACRRDMINNLETIQWHMLCESATDFGTPKHQTEQNVLSLKIIPLWGLDFLTPTHGLFKNRLYAEVDMLESAATNLDIERNFIPTLTALVKGARAISLSNADLQQATRAIVNLHDYFCNKRHWSEVWKSDVSKAAWRSLWLQDMPNTRPTKDWLDTELPTLCHFDTALELWLRYLFVFSIQVPDNVPAIFQASHHSVSAAYGIVVKLKHKCQLQIWDHAIAWRETNMCLSSALCKLPPFVRNALLGLMRLTSVLVLHNADTILPCADFFNPGWEVEIGTCQGTLEHRNQFRRKISPIVNGITDAEKFKPVKEITTKMPTVTMLSHLWFAKDLKTSLLAADIICNEWGFQDYRLDIYGSIEKAPMYSNDCQELLASKGLGAQVKLCGTANPMKVLESTWLFLNSSLSEGLPLALGEAALTGAPVVCTDVGASLRVLSDPDDFSRYSAVVAPNDARALARAQIKMLAMLDEWGKYAEDEGESPIMPFAPTKEDVAWITARMYEKTKPRRKLGLMTRRIVQKSFAGARYLREHEQMLWIGKSRKVMETRNYKALSDDPADILHALQLNSGMNEQVIPYSAAPSMRAPSVMSSSSMALSNNRSSTPVISEEMAPLTDPRSISRLSQRTSSRLSMAMVDTELSTFKLPPPQMTALPKMPVEISHRRSSWRRNFSKIPILPSLVAEEHARYSRAAGSEKPSPSFSPYPMHSDRYRNSDFSLARVNLDVHGNNMNITMMEPPEAKREESAYRNLSRSPSPGPHVGLRARSQSHAGRVLPRLHARASSGRMSPGFDVAYRAGGLEAMGGGRASPRLTPMSSRGRMSPAVDKSYFT